MDKNQNEFDQQSPFENHFLNDPFRDEQLVFQHNEKKIHDLSAQPKETKAHDQKEHDGVFKLHVEHHPHHHQPKKEQQSLPPEKPKHQHSEEKRSFKGILKDATKQIVASAVILVIGFLALNFQAYYQIAKSKVEEITGTKEESPLEVLVNSDAPTISDQSDIEPTVQVTRNFGDSEELPRFGIPNLDIEVSPLNNRLVIPRIDKNIPVVRVSSQNLINRDWGALENQIQEALQLGVVHYPGTSLPGQSGNTVITGHSSYFPWDPGRFKDVFALLHDVVIGDLIVVYFEQEKIIYEIEEIKIVLPSDIEVLKQTPGERLTLITCTPVGTNLKRLIVIAKPVSPITKNTKGKVIR